MRLLCPVFLLAVLVELGVLALAVIEEAVDDVHVAVLELLRLLLEDSLFYLPLPSKVKIP